MNTIKLGNLVDIRGGKRLPKGTMFSKDITSHPYIRVRDISQERLVSLSSDYEYIDDETANLLKRYTVKTGDILLSIVGTIGNIGIVDKSLNNANLTENCVKITNFSKQIEPDYLYYFLKSPNGYIQIKKGIVGAVQQKLPIKNIESIEIPVIPLKEQLRIIQILRSIDEKIMVNNAINDNLLNQAQNVFKAISHDTALEWRNFSLGEVSVISAGGDKPDSISEIRSDKYPFPIYSNGIDNEGLYGFTNKAKIFSESVTVSARGTIGYVCLRHIPYVPIVRLISLVPNPTLLSAKYLYFFLKELHISGTGTTQQQLTVPDFRKTRIMIPDKKTMDRFTNCVTPLFNKIWTNEEENSRLSALRDALLPKLIAGDSEISDL